MDNGVKLLRNFEVSTIELADHYTVRSSDGRVIETEYVINCAGLHSDKVAHMVGDDSFKITPKAGEYMLLDKDAGSLIESTIFRVPDERGKGVLATKTVDGNILLGPTAVVRDCKDDESVTSDSLQYIKERESEFFENVPFDKVITQFAGLRAHSNAGDFIINSPKPKFINVAGIESPGLSSAPAIALEVEKLLLDIGFDGEKKKDYSPFRSKTKHPDSQIICRCEEVSKAEIIDAIRRNPGAVDVDGIKRRTRSGMGRCQGGFCLPSIIEILAEELGVKPEEITKKGKSSQILYGRVKGGERL
jgi:glycerol-3-phosphate dehydrogenase